MRLFFAITLPDDVRELLAGVQAGLRARMGREGIRWEDPGKLHVTLRFLGEIAADRLDAVKQAGREAAGAHAPFALELGGVGTFPKRGAPRVLWVGAKSGLPEFAGLAEYLEGTLLAQSFRDEAGGHGPDAAKQAHPHITLARAKSPQGSAAIRAVLRENNLQKIVEKVDKEGVISVYNIVLIESELRPGGSVYTVVETFPLAAGPTPS